MPDAPKVDLKQLDAITRKVLEHKPKKRPVERKA